MHRASHIVHTIIHTLAACSTCASSCGQASSGPRPSHTSGRRLNSSCAPRWNSSESSSGACMSASRVTCNNVEVHVCVLGSRVWPAPAESQAGGMPTCRFQVFSQPVLAPIPPGCPISHPVTPPAPVSHPLLCHHWPRVAPQDRVCYAHALEHSAAVLNQLQP